MEFAQLPLGLLAVACRLDQQAVQLLLGADDHITADVRAVVQDVVRSEVADDSAYGRPMHMVIAQILRIPVDSEAGHFLLGDPHGALHGLLVALQYVESEDVERRTVAAEHRHPDEAPVLVFRLPFLCHSREIGAAAYPAHAGQGGRLFGEDVPQPPVFELYVEIPLDVNAGRAMGHVGDLKAEDHCEGQKDDGEDLLQHDEYLAEHVFVPGAVFPFDHGDGRHPRADPGRQEPLDHRQQHNEHDIYGQPAWSIKHPHGHHRAYDPVEPGRECFGEQGCQNETDSRKGERFQKVAADQGPLSGSEDLAGCHFLGAFSRKGDAEVDVIENGRQQKDDRDQKDDAGKGPVSSLEGQVVGRGEPDLVVADKAAVLQELPRAEGVERPGHQRVSLHLQSRPVSPFANFDEGDDVEHERRFLPVGEVLYAGDDVNVAEDRIGGLLDDGRDGQFTVDDAADGLLHPAQAVRKGAADDSIGIIHEHLWAAVVKLGREDVEEIPAHHARLDVKLLSAHFGHIFIVLSRLPEHRGLLHFRDTLLGLIGEAPGLSDARARASRPVEGIDVLVVRDISRHQPLLPHKVPGEQHERQTHGQPHRLDGGVQFVPRQEFQVGFH